MSTDADLTDDDFDKIVGLFRLKLGGLLTPLRIYGQGVYVDGVMGEIESLAIQLHLKLSGVDMPYEVRELPW